jgi:hypothetical protein
VSLVKRYAAFATSHPFLLLFIAVLLSFAAYHEVSKLELEASSFVNMFPEDLEVIKAFKIAEDQFFGSQNMYIVVFIDGEQASPHSVKDIREPEVAKYIYALQKKTESLESITGSTSYVDLLLESSGRIPTTLEEIKDILKASPLGGRFVSSDAEMALINLRMSDIEGREKEFMEDLESTISSISPPPGVRAVATGDPAMRKVFLEHTSLDMQNTTKFSLVGILFLTAVVLYSIRFSLLPLLSVSVGTFWAFGFMGFMGIKISSTMAGVASMIMGIGIDFAIQIIGRYLQEMQGYFGSARATPEEALRVTLENVMQPMAVTTLAALIGFRAMSMGELSFMKDLANVMSIGVLACMVSALTLVPSLILILNRIKEVKI